MRIFVDGGQLGAPERLFPVEKCFSGALGRDRMGWHPVDATATSVCFDGWAIRHRGSFGHFEWHNVV